MDIFQEENIDCNYLVRAYQCLNSVLNVKAVVAAFNQEKALVGISSYEKITTVTHKQLFIKVHVHAQKSPWTNHWQPLDCGLIIRWSCFKLPLYFPIILDVTHKLFWLLSVVNMNFVLFPTSFDTHIFKCWLPQYL